MPVTFRLSGMTSQPAGERPASPEENIAYWRELHESNAYFEQHRRYRERLRPIGLDWLERLLEPGSDDVLLEVGCGYGRLLWHLAPRVRRAIGVDLAPAPIAEAEKLLADRGNVELCVGDGVSLAPVADESVTAAYAFTVFQHMSRQVALANAREVARTLAPGGRFVVQLYVGDGRDELWATRGEQSLGYTAAQAAGLLEDAGLTVERLERELLLDRYPDGNVAWWWVVARKG